jgi:hypothetical protein
VVEAGRVSVLVKYHYLFLHVDRKVGLSVLPCSTNFTYQVANEAQGELGACDCFFIHKKFKKFRNCGLRVQNISVLQWLLRRAANVSRISILTEIEVLS